MPCGGGHPSGLAHVEVHLVPHQGRLKGGRPECLLQGEPELVSLQADPLA